MNSDKRTFAKRIVSLSTLAMILQLASVSFGGSPAARSSVQHSGTRNPLSDPGT